MTRSRTRRPRPRSSSGSSARRSPASSAEVTDDKTLPKAERKRLQVEHAALISREAKLVKLADKICNVRDMVDAPPAHWDLARRQEYFEWAKEVVDQIRGTHPKLEQLFDAAYAGKP